MSRGASPLATGLSSPTEPEVSALRASIPSADAALVKFGAEMFDILFDAFCDGHYEIELFDLIQKNAAAAGLVEKTVYDPEQHDSECECEAGDEYYVITPTGRAACAKARGRS